MTFLNRAQIYKAITTFPEILNFFKDVLDLHADLISSPSNLVAYGSRVTPHVQSDRCESKLVVLLKVENQLFHWAGTFAVALLHFDSTHDLNNRLQKACDDRRDGIDPDVACNMYPGDTTLDALRNLLS